MNKPHSFHIPVMGIGFTIDTPLKISRYGIDSVIFIGDHDLIEKMREKICTDHQIAYHKIEKSDEDFGARRITEYLNLIQSIVKQQFKDLKSNIDNNNDELIKYFELLDNDSILKKEYIAVISSNISKAEKNKWMLSQVVLGDINVNIMTKLDKVNYKDGEALPVEYNDAHSAVRGFAESNLNSSLVLSAGMNPRLFTYLERFDDFFPNKAGEIKKKIVLKVSDYRSALIQGKFLAKKGIWVSEYRIESGLNCGGHAFATEGKLMGPILKEFKNNKTELITSTAELLKTALIEKGKVTPQKELKINISAQGGIGTSEEHRFLTKKYDLDSIGWGSPFLLVPEVSNVDQITLKKLSDAKENDLYLSGISPLGVPFNNLRGNTKDSERIKKIKTGKPGSKCPKEILALNAEYPGRTICTASRKYQRLKLKELDEKKNIITEKEYNSHFEEITEKTCICVGLGTSALLVNGINSKAEGINVSICPGPNLAYYSQICSLKDMTNHIYGTKDIILRKDRPMVFIKEFNLYLNYLQMQVNKMSQKTINRKQEKYLKNFAINLSESIIYYTDLFKSEKFIFKNEKTILADLLKSEQHLSKIKVDINELLSKEVV